jgi:superfamily II DNA/RNA helicase
VHAPGLGSLQTAQVRTFTSLLQAPNSLPAEGRDPWWTLLSFFNSLRELGTTLSLFQSDIPDYLKAFRNRTGLTKEQVRRLRKVKELTGRLPSNEIPEAISELEATYDGERTPIDVCLASNLIEVGVDIDRLSLMTVVGQPKTTSQYIQVTGRVGRLWWERPALVVTIYVASKPRDRSHFEKFRSYHERLYAQVEPSSVTPYSRPALDRALHAVMTAYVRQLGNQNLARSPYPFPADLLQRLSEQIVPRVAYVDANELESFKRLFDARAEEWRRWERTRYSASAADAELPLLRVAGAYASREHARISWPTPQSMRNVDAECQVEITTLYLNDRTDPNA